MGVKGPWGISGEPFTSVPELVLSGLLRLATTIVDTMDSKHVGNCYIRQLWIFEGGFPCDRERLKLEQTGEEDFDIL